MGNTVSKIYCKAVFVFIVATTAYKQRTLLVEDIHPDAQAAGMQPRGDCIHRAALDDTGRLKYPHITDAVLRECGIEKVYAFTDVHGAYKPMLNMLQHHRIIKLDGEITKDSIHKPIDIEVIARNAIIIFAGDAVDRGSQSVGTLLFLMHLHQQMNVAETRTAHNSLFIYLMGNHEEYYLTLGLPQTYGGSYSWKEQWLPSIPFTEHEFEQWGLTDSGKVSRFFGIHQPIGNFLRNTLLLGVVVGDTFYSHAGFTSTFCQHLSQEFSIENSMELLHELNSAWTESAKSRQRPYWLDRYWLGYGPTLNREYSFDIKLSDSPIEVRKVCDAVTQFLKEFGYAKNMFIGHNHDVFAVSKWCGGKLIKADVDLYWTERPYLSDPMQAQLGWATPQRIAQRNNPDHQMYVYDVKGKTDNIMPSTVVTEPAEDLDASIQRLQQDPIISWGDLPLE